MNYHSNKTKWIIALSLITLLVSPLLLLCVYVCTNSYIFAMDSPTGKGTAVIYTDAWPNSALFVHDISTGRWESVQPYMNVQEGKVPMGLTWSKDGTLVVTNSPTGVWNESSHTYVIYDYVQHQTLKYVTEEQLAALLQQRGGEGKGLNFKNWDGYYKQSRYAWPWEIRRFWEVEAEQP
jgi:hypothetical protein